MTTEHPLGLASRVIATRRPADEGSWYLFVVAKKLLICRRKTVPKNTTPVATLSAKDINCGLSSHHWSQIESKIRSLRKEGKL